MWFMVCCCWPQSRKGDWARPHLCKLAQHGPWPVRKQKVIGQEEDSTVPVHEATSKSTIMIHDRHCCIRTTCPSTTAQSNMVTVLTAHDTHTHTHPFNGPFSETTRVGWYKKGKTNLDFTVARDSEWQWYQLGHMQVCTSLQTDNHASTPPLSFLQAGCPSCCPTNSVKALKAVLTANQQI